MTYPFKQWTPVLGDRTWIADSADVVGNDTFRQEIVPGARF